MRSSLRFFERPQIWPNLRIVELGDRALARDGALIAAAHRVYRRQIGDKLHLMEQFRSGGRGREIEAALAAAGERYIGMEFPISVKGVLPAARSNRKNGAETCRAREIAEELPERGAKAAEALPYRPNRGNTACLRKSACDRSLGRHAAP